MTLRMFARSTQTSSRISPHLVTTLAFAAALACSACGGSDSSPTSPSNGGGSPSASVTSITLGVPGAAQVGGVLQVAAFAQYSNLTAGDVTRTATWSSSNTQIAVLTTFGGLPAFQMLRVGTVTITASIGGKSASQSVVVQ